MRWAGEGKRMACSCNNCRSKLELIISKRIFTTDYREAQETRTWPNEVVSAIRVKETCTAADNYTLCSGSATNRR